MNPGTTTHLICAPQLDEPALVLRIGPQSGHDVAANAALVHLLCAGEEVLIQAPDAGQVGQIMVSVGDAVHAGDLLLMMEIAEADTQLYPLQVDDVVFAPACQLPPARPAPVAADEFVVTRAAARLAARMGVDLGMVADVAGRIDEEQVFDYVRQQLQNPPR
ncbi:biotin/lipoyl-containing protein [Chitinilyticum aquatile]|uniref:biotin/lipoyl-containing protein n=1 Tax=Chitinilyticum aquatile TaxID=362520 RepID=UPI0003FDEB87|nr:biotin/lipoyl-containing protein [Chitinilyticum aquatile]